MAYKSRFELLWFIGPLGLSWFAAGTWMNLPGQSASIWPFAQCILATLIAVVIWIGVSYNYFKRTPEERSGEKNGA